MNGRRKIGVFLAVVTLVGAGAGFWLYRTALRPDRLAETVRHLIEQAIGQPIGMESVHISGIAEVSFRGVRIPDSSALGEGREPWLRVEEARVHLNLSGFLPGMTPSIRVRMDGPRLHLRKTPESGWNFLRRFGRPQHETGSSSSPVEGRSDEEPVFRTLAISLQTTKTVVSVEDPLWGVWKIRIPEPSETGILIDRESGEARIAVAASGEISGEVPEGGWEKYPRVFRNFYRTFGGGNFQASIRSRLRLSPRQWEIASNHSKSLEVESLSSSFRIGRFRVAGDRYADKPIRLGSISIETATAEFSSWSNPVIAELNLPLAAPPEGEAEIVFREFRYNRETFRFHVDGLHFDSVVLPGAILPWLNILEQPEGWRLEEVAVDVNLEIQKNGRWVRWSHGKVSFASGREGAIESEGYLTDGPSPEWHVSLRLQEFPIPDQVVAGSRYRLGLLSGEMTWGRKKRKKDEKQKPLFFGKGKVELSGGDLGAIRLLEGIEELLNLEDLASRTFTRFGFSFNLAEDLVGIEHLFLESSLLRMEGSGTYGPGSKVRIEVVTQAGPELAGAVRSATAARVIAGIADASEPLRVLITGNIERPAYRFIAGEGTRVPIGDFPLPFRN